MTLKLRPYQEESVEALRQGFRDKHIRQVLCASTGAGKSRIMEYLIRAAMEKGSRVMFVCERRILVEQFSAHLDRAGIDHGILMAGHWRFKPGRLVQIASAQTLERMDALPVIDLLFIDELHAAMRKSIKALLDRNHAMRVIGATATPFHPAIGKYFTNVVSVTTMDRLVKEEFLVPFRVFVAKEIDTKGLKVVAGEWKKDDLEKRGQQIVGDVVSDYIRISHDVFGGYRKTICFSCGIAHGAELAQKFNEAGVNAVQISSEDNEDYRDEVLKDFAKPESDIKVVISVAILSRGFDQSDVDYVILARPLKKSFSEHVQMMGRGARIHPGKSFCIARDSMVLTDSGLVKIQDVTLDNKVWDGVNFVSHQGSICRGVKPVLSYGGVTATQDHEVMTNEGWKKLEEASSRCLGIAKTGDGRNPIRLSDNLFSTDKGEFRQLARGSVLQQVRDDPFLQVPQHKPEGRNKGLPVLQPKARSFGPKMGLPTLHVSAAAMRKSIKLGIREIRDAWRSIQLLVGCGCRELGGSRVGYSELQKISIGQDKQRRPLRARKYPLGDSGHEHEQHKGFWRTGEICKVQGEISRGSVCGQHPKEVNCFDVVRADCGEVQQAEPQTEREVWDILGAGPLQRFTVDGRLVHNCVIQDNSGNFLRFADDWDKLYHEGVTELGQGQDAKPKKEPTDKEKEAAKCPKCSVVWAGGDTCLHCGHVRTKRNDVVALAGEMMEIDPSAKRKKEKFTAEYKADFYAQLLGHAQITRKNPGWAYHTYRERFGVGPSMARPKPIPPNEAVSKWIGIQAKIYADSMKATKKAAA